MAKKVIGIGNKFMMDDGVAIFVLESIKNSLEDIGMEVIFGETDVDFSFSKLNCYDEFYIIDSTCNSNSPGTVVFTTLEDIKKSKINKCMSHSLGLLNLIKIYELDIKGYFIGIEIRNIDMNIGLSNVLQEQFDSICSKVLNFIIGTVINK